MRKIKFGYIKDGNYIRIGDNMHGIYKTYDDMRFNWQLVSQTEGDITKYYLLNNKNEAIEYVGRKDPWSPLTVGTKEQYLYMDTGQTHQNYSDKNCNISNCKTLIINALDLFMLDIFRIFIV